MFVIFFIYTAENHRFLIWYILQFFSKFINLPIFDEILYYGRQRHILATNFNL